MKYFDPILTQWIMKHSRIPNKNYIRRNVYGPVITQFVVNEIGEEDFSIEINESQKVTVTCNPLFGYPTGVNYVS